jgi:hypothetical protein
MCSPYDPESGVSKPLGHCHTALGILPDDLGDGEVDRYLTLCATEGLGGKQWFVINWRGLRKRGNQDRARRRNVLFEP